MEISSKNQKNLRQIIKIQLKFFKIFLIIIIKFKILYANRVSTENISKIDSYFLKIQTFFKVFLKLFLKFL
jgi:hypothetical protein